MKATRYNPLLMVLKLWHLIRNTSVIFFYVFVVKSEYQSTLYSYLRIGLIVAFVFTVLYIILKWFTEKYQLEEEAIHLYKGVFQKSQRMIPYSKIQDITRHRSLFHRLFMVTSMKLETGIEGQDATVKFEVVSQKEAKEIERHLNIVADDEWMNKTLHFTPAKKDILKASITSFSFLVLIPIIASLYTKMDELFHVEEEAAGILKEVINYGWLVTILLLVLAIVSTIIGVMKTYIKYGNYEIFSDYERIYIKKGVIEESSFSIAKSKVQAIEINQSPVKRLFGLAEVKLTSAGSESEGDDGLAVNSLYPFLPVKRTYEMVSEILPSYEVIEEMNPLPKKSLLLRMVRPSWIWIIATGCLYYFKPTPLNIEEAWGLVSIILLGFILVTRFLGFLNTRYILNKNFIQYKKGILGTSLFISKRDKIIEVNVERNMMQQLLGLATIETINRGKPVKHRVMRDVPVEFAHQFYKWYMGRRNEIKVTLHNVS